MKSEQLQAFKILGIAIETTNENGESAKDLGNLWRKFYSENITDKIDHKESDDIFSIYTDYESGYKGKYTTIIGCKVNTLNQIPNGLMGREFKGGKYLKFIAKGQMPDAVVNVWKQIWASDETLNRAYTFDFEVYGENSNKGENSEVDIYIAVV